MVCSQCGATVAEDRMDFDHRGEQVCRACSAQAKAAVDAGVRGLEPRVRMATVGGTLCAGVFGGLFCVAGFLFLLTPVLLGAFAVALGVSARNKAMGGDVAGASKLVRWSYVVSGIGLVSGLAVLGLMIFLEKMGVS